MTPGMAACQGNSPPQAPVVGVADQGAFVPRPCEGRLPGPDVYAGTTPLHPTGPKKVYSPE